MKKISVFLVLVFIFVSYVYAEQKVNVEDWEKYQQYKQEQSNKISVSDKEYEEYQQYLQEQEKANKEQNAVENKEIQKESSSEQQSNIETKAKDNKVNENELVFKIGKILTMSDKAKIKNTYTGISATNTETSSDGWDIKVDFFHYLLNNTAIGCGLSYQTNFESNETTFIDVDILLKQRFPLNFRENTYLYLIGGLGYGYLFGKTKAYLQEYPDYYLKLSGGIHWRLSFGIDFTPFLVELTYTYNNIDVSTNLPNITAEESVNIFMLSVGYKFEL